jgi:tetratricopeptide (TPR) repeat protein
LLQGDKRGEQYVKESLALSADLGNRVSMTAGFYQAIMALMLLGSFAEARSLLEEKNTLEQGRGFRQDTTHTLLADTLISLGNYENARFHAVAGLELARRLGDEFVLGYALIVRGWLALAEEDHETARDYFQESAQHCHDCNLKELLSLALSFLGFTQRELGQHQLGLSYSSAALRIALETRSFFGAVFTLTSSVPLIADCIAGDLALECHAAVSDFPMIANSRFFDDVIGLRVATIESDLPPDVAAQAKERGRQHQVMEAVIEMVLKRWDQTSPQLHGEDVED